MARPAHPMRELELQRNVIELMKLTGWLHYHTFDSRRSAAGFPDIVAVSLQQRRVIFVELKTEGGSITTDQKVWLEWLEAAGQEAYVWRPRHWNDGTIERALQP